MSVKSKVMLFSHICHPDRMSGAEKWLLFLARILTGQYEVVLVVPCAGMLSIEAETAGIRIVIQDSPLLWSLYESSPAMHQEFAKQEASNSYQSLLTLLHMHRPDWVIVNTAVNALPAAAAKKAGIPVAWIINEILYPEAHQIDAVRIVNRYADWIIGISEAVLAPFKDSIVNNKKRLISPSWNDTELHPEKWEENRRYLRAVHNIVDHETLIGLVSGIVSAHKGIDQFINMAGRLIPHFPQAKFLIAGSLEITDYFNKCQTLAHSTLDPSRIIFLPFAKHIEQLYPALDVVVVPSMIDEGFGMTALEGMAFGKPVVAYDSAGLGELLQNTGNEEFLVPKGDVDRLSQTIADLLQHKDHMLEIGTKNRKEAVESFGIGIFQNRLNNLLQEIDAVVHDLKKTI
ncbi:glycosyl transferase [Paenibacillus kribbensis]|uniref:Glycosyl transferase n=1 Tax=Paenibacillus kribbensis TaxID=172713 RepID=A0A222WIA1_9BACL|nr:glycosyltransferase family 4 protein [Paenibacillus kribbensis]ASR46137.1 glycosyl transferase [Paenibacillus kribbensis]